MRDPIATLALYRSPHTGRPGERGMRGQCSTLWLRVERCGRAPTWHRVDEHRGLVSALASVLEADGIEGDPEGWNG